MKVLHLIDSAGLYGAETVLLHLIAEQKKQGIETILGSIGKPDISEKGIENAAKQRNIAVQKFRMRNGPNLYGAISIIRFSKEQYVDIIHCHGYKANILMGMLPAGYRKIPYLVTLHGWTAVKRFSKMWWYGWADALFAKRAGVVVVVSEAMYCHPLVLTVGLEPVTVHNGIPQAATHIKLHSKDNKCFRSAGLQPCTGADLKVCTTKISNDLNATWYHIEDPGGNNGPLNAFCNSQFIIGAIGRLSPEKGFGILINAVADVIEKGYDISLVIIGDGSNRPKLENLACTRGIRHKVLFTGYLEQANQCLGYFDVLVISSLTEGLPIILLEAMQAGLPVIATRVGGIPEALDNGRCGMLVNPKDEHALSQAIIKLYDLPELRSRLAASAMEMVKQEFSSEKMEQSYRKLYEKLLTRITHKD